VQLEKVTQSTAATAEESAASSEELSAQAEMTKRDVETLIAIVNGQGRRADGGAASRSTPRIEVAGPRRLKKTA
jgi:methyl-accepting chemotaxis protein